MEAALAYFATSAGTAAAASAATSATVVTAAQSGTAALASYGSMIGTGLTAASAFGSVMSGFQENAVYKGMAKQSELSAKTEELKGREQADKIRRSLNATLASQNAAFAARGVSLTSGTPVNIGNVSRTEAGRDIENAQFGANTTAAAERSQASQYRLTGKSAITRGFASGGFAGRSLIRG